MGSLYSNSILQRLQKRGHRLLKPPMFSRKSLCHKRCRPLLVLIRTQSFWLMKPLTHKAAFSDSCVVLSLSSCLALRIYRSDDGSRPFKPILSSLSFDSLSHLKSRGKRKTPKDQGYLVLSDELSTIPASLSSLVVAYLLRSLPPTSYKTPPH